jgi:hypothetical protein
MSWRVGRLVSVRGTEVEVQDVTLGTVTTRRQWPSCITRGMFRPEGTPVRLKVPSGPEVVETSGVPEISQEHAFPFATPSTNSVTPYGNVVAPFGT